MTRILIADDHQLLRQALRRAFEDAGVEVVAEAGDGEEAIRLTGETRPELVLIDMSMPVLDGIEATRRLRVEHPDLPVVMLTMHGEEALRREAIDAGAAAFLTKDSSMTDVVRVVLEVAGDDVALSPELAASMLRELGPPDPEAPEDTPPAEASTAPLTPREAEILQLIADGYSTSEVAQRLFISAKTVKNHLASIYGKLDARDRTQAVLSAVRIGIVRLR
jgi:DNA-binding NarL/FixJ family response regulator